MEYIASYMERFWSKVRKLSATECWEWTGATTARGYGKFLLNGKQTTAPRALMAMVHGPLNEDTYVCHRCDNPRCVNPAHLFLGTQLDNIRDMYAKGRGPVGDRNGSRTKPHRRVRGERVNTSKLTRDQAKTVRELNAIGFTRTELSKMYGLTYRSIRAIVLGLTWK